MHVVFFCNTKHCLKIRLILKNVTFYDNHHRYLFCFESLIVLIKEIKLHFSRKKGVGLVAFIARPGTSKSSVVFGIHNYFTAPEIKPSISRRFLN